MIENGDTKKRKLAELLYVEIKDNIDRLENCVRNSSCSDDLEIEEFKTFEEIVTKIINAYLTMMVPDWYKM